MNDGGKGSAPRPFSVSNEEYAKRWDAIFGRDVKEDVENQQMMLTEEGEKPQKEQTNG